MGNGHTNGNRLEAAAESTVLKLAARWMMAVFVPALLGIIGLLGMKYADKVVAATEENTKALNEIRGDFRTLVDGKLPAIVGKLNGRIDTETGQLRSRIDAHVERLKQPRPAMGRPAAPRRRAGRQAGGPAAACLAHPRARAPGATGSNANAAVYPALPEVIRMKRLCVLCLLLAGCEVVGEGGATVAGVQAAGVRQCAFLPTEATAEKIIAARPALGDATIAAQVCEAVKTQRRGSVAGVAIEGVTTRKRI